MIIPADMPLISPKDYEVILHAFQSQKYRKIICPRNDGKNGNPLILPKSCFDLLISLNKDEGAKQQLPIKKFFFVKTGIGTTFDIDSKNDLDRAKLLMKEL